MATQTEIRCSFCGKSQAEVEKLIAGPDVQICDGCVTLCGSFLGRDYRKVDIEALGFKPRFKKLKFDLRDNHCFYLGPFCDPFNTIYCDHIVKAAQREGFSIERADDIFGTQPIIEDIWEAINSSTVVIADATERNPNVMYEIGMAHTVGKPVVILAQTIDDVPFDLKHYRCVIYTYTPRGCAELEEKVAQTIRFLKKRTT